MVISLPCNFAVSLIIVLLLLLFILSLILSLVPNLHSLLLIQPSPFKSSLIQFTQFIHRFSKGTSGNWRDIPTVTPLTLQYQSSVSPVSPFCSASQESCSVCGVCSNSTICIGEDDEIFGRDINDCPSGQVIIHSFISHSQWIVEGIVVQ